MTNGTDGAGQSTAKTKVKKRRQEILDAAAQVFYEKGYDAASTHDIADAVGILKGSLYYYVETKEDLLFEVIKEAHDLAVGMVESVRGLDATVEERFTALVRGHIRFYLDNRVKASVFFRDFISLSPERRRAIDALGRSYRALVTDLIVEGQRSGVVNDELDPHIAGLALVEMLNSVSRWYRPEGPDSADHVLEQYETILLSGFVRGSVALRPSNGERSSGRASTVRQTTGPSSRAAKAS